MLTRKPMRSVYQETPVDDTVVSSSDGGGYQQTLARTTRDIYVYKIAYQALTDTDRDMIKAVDAACGSSEWFYWTHPISGDIKEVRFKTRPDLRRPYVNRSRLTFELKDV